MTVAQMQTELDAMLDPLDIPRSWTQRELDAYETQRRVLAANIRAATLAEAEVAALEPDVEQERAWCNQGREWLSQFEERRAACPTPPKTRDDEYERLGLDISIRCLRVGFDFANSMYPPNLPLFDAMTAAGYRAPASAPYNVWLGGRGPLPQAEHRLAELQSRLDDARRRLERAMRDRSVSVTDEGAPAER